MVTEQQDQNRRRESGLSAKFPLGGDDGTWRRRRGKRRARDQVETGQGCTPAGEDKDSVGLVRQALSPSGWLLL